MITAKKLTTIVKILLLALLASFSVVFFAYHLAYAQRVIPGVSVAGVNVGNRSPQEVLSVLQGKAAAVAAHPVRFSSNDKNYESTTRELGIEYDLEQTVKEALLIGRSGNILTDIRTDVRTWFKGQEVAPVIRIDEEKFAGAISIITDELDRKPQDARFVFKDNDVLSIESEEQGRIIDQKRLREDLLASLQNFRGGEVTIVSKEVRPRLTVVDLERVKSQVEELVANPPSLRYGEQNWRPTAAETLGLVTVVSEDGRPTVAARQDSVETYVQKIARQINREPRGDVFKLQDGKVVEFRLAQGGLRLNEEETTKLLSAALLAENTTAITLPIETAQPARSANDYGIKNLLGRGVSNFAGSSAGRIHNIQTAAGRLKGLLVAPGETFSFNNSLGEVSAATGYDQAYIISQGRTILGTGGGVCQVSTTVFRAAFNSGLEIVKRTAHAYRVHYYEPPIGFDATVYAPAPDLVFKNDTANHILIWSSVDLANTTLTFEIYGTADGRQTEMIGPFVQNETPPPPPLYQEDPTLPKGTTKQIDWAAWGADATLKRKVYRNGEILHDDTFFSRFQPWQAVFLVGTKET